MNLYFERYFNIDLELIKNTFIKCKSEQGNGGIFYINEVFNTKNIKYRNNYTIYYNTFEKNRAKIGGLGFFSYIYNI